MSNDKQIPEFQSYEEIAEFWDTHNLADYWEETEPAVFEISEQDR
ncbi:MAG: CopG family antitoxin [Candidatus Entotheonellia bacterium]